MLRFARGHGVAGAGAGVGAGAGPGLKLALAQARAAIVIGQPDAPEADKVEAVQLLAQRGDQEVLGIRRRCRLRPPTPCAPPPFCRRRDRRPAEAGGSGPERLVYGVSLGSVLLLAADRPRHHLRRDGRHQHGAWRDGHARRLHNLCHPGVLSHQLPGLSRMVAAGRHPAGLPGRRRDGCPDRAQHHPHALWPAA